MTISHHLSDDLVVSYAAGALAEGWSLAVASHLALCPACRARVAEAEAVGGQMLAGIAPQQVAEDSWTQLRAKLAATPQEQPTAVSRPAPGAILPKVLQDYVGGDVDAIKWRPLGLGAAQCLIRTKDRETQVRLLKIPAGKPVPEHSHGGRELTLVLSGAFADEEGRFGRGDIEDADGSLTHQPVATPDADCICLAVTDAPLRFRSWMVRALQPVLGI